MRITQTTVYYTAPPAKFVALAVCSFGLYEFYWFYKNWQAVRARDGRRVSPLWRATFAPFYAYTLFSDILGGDHKRKAVALTVAYAASLLCMGLPAPWHMLATLGAVPLLLANNAARARNRAADPGFAANERLGAGGWAMVIAGGFVMLLMLAGLFIDEQTVLRGAQKNMPATEALPPRFLEMIAPR